MRISSIFRGLRGSRVFVSDPALGNMTMRSSKFMELWKCRIGLVLSKEGKVNPNSPLVLSKEERAIFADPEVRKTDLRV